MRLRSSMFGTAAAVVGLAAWASPAPSQQTRTGASAVPCAAPLGWRVARVDAEFGIDDAQATAALQEAADLWEEAVGRQLFVHDASEGFPVRLVYDERQERTQERLRRQGVLDGAGEALEGRGAELRRLADELNEAQRRHEELLQDYEGRVAAHNDTVREWNDRGGAPVEEQRRLSLVAERLQGEREDLEARSREMEARGRELQEEQRRLNRQVDDHNRRTEALARDFPLMSVESGIYREAVRTENGRVASVGREIRIYRFGDLDALRLVAAHELGHALGLEHTAEPAAVMSPQHEEGGSAVPVVAVHPADVELFAQTCPALVGGSR